MYFSPCMIRRIIEILLAGAIVFIGYQLYISISGPVKWQKEKATRYKAIKKELIDIRDAQIVFKGEKGHYAKNFVELRYFLSRGSVKKYFKNIVSKENTAAFVLVNPADSIFGKGYNVSSLGFVPYSNPQQTFDITIVNSNNIEYIEISDPNPFDPDDPLSIGSTIEPTLRASWETK